MGWLVSHNRIKLQFSVAEWLDQVQAGGVVIVPVTRDIAMRAVALPEHHKDPVDRIIFATAIEHQAQLLSVDTRFPDYIELHGALIS